MNRLIVPARVGAPGHGKHRPGKIGSQMILIFSRRMKTVRVVVRDPSKLAPQIRKQVEIVTGSLDDEVVLEQALKGAESVFLVVTFPPHGANDAQEQPMFSVIFSDIRSPSEGREMGRLSRLCQDALAPH
jgi:uncharacterized protein YbjT (DUF2867 family)